MRSLPELPISCDKNYLMLKNRNININNWYIGSTKLSYPRWLMFFFNPLFGTITPIDLSGTISMKGDVINRQV
jgi:hypothetical protein